MFSRITLMHLCSMQLLWIFITLKRIKTTRMNKKKTNEKAFEVPVNIFRGIKIKSGKYIP